MISHHRLLRGTKLEKWEMASEQRTELTADAEVRLRQVSPVIANRVNDPMRFALREADEQKWYHGYIARLLLGIEDGLSLCLQISN